MKFQKCKEKGISSLYYSLSPVPAGGAGCTHGHAELLPLELPILGLGGLTEAAARPGHRAGTRPGL